MAAQNGEHCTVLRSHGCPEVSQKQLQKKLKVFNFYFADLFLLILESNGLALRLSLRVT